MSKKEAPIEQYYPISQVNEIANKESKAKKHYRPPLIMHKWWARRLGCVFRSMLLYSLTDEEMSVADNKTDLSSWNSEDFDFQKYREDPEKLWDDFYLKDFEFDKRILDPFMGGGTTVLEGVRTNSEVIGKDLNPVAWFNVKKQIEPVDKEELEEKYQEVKNKTEKEIEDFYKTNCPECEETADAMYFFWVKELDCRNCGSTNSLFKNYKVAKSRSTNVEHKNKIYLTSIEEFSEEFEENSDKNLYHVHCPECDEIFETDNRKEENECPECSNLFTPKNGPASGKYFTCQVCGQKNETIENIEQKGKPAQRLWAIEYYCGSCDKKGYKKADQRDKELYQEAEEEYEIKKDDLPIPQQEIPEGKETHPRLENHGYQNFKDLFNKRQLLSIGTLYNQIESIEDQNLKEFLIIPLSDSLQYNNQFCEYDYSNNKLSKMFRNHAFRPTLTPVEGNFLGTKYGMGSFEQIYAKVKDAIEYKNNPWEKYTEEGKTKEKKMSIDINEEVATTEKELDEKNVMLTCGDSSYLEIEDKSVDAVITDPPYFDNVQYSELSDFYYVWLREALKDEYDYFQSEYAPKSAEAVKNNAQNKGKDEFTDSLTQILAESRRKLKDDGLMAFTFHHQETDAWSSVLESVLNAGFYITAIYPVQAEMDTSMHIREKDNVNYDMIIVCRKRDDEPEEGIWSEMEDRIYLEAKKKIAELEEEGEHVARGDQFVIVLGKCLEIYSKHYPEVYRDGEKVTVSDALDSIREIVEDQIQGGKFDEIADETDTLSAIYLSYIAGRGKERSYSSLNKTLQQSGLNIAKLTESNLVKSESGQIMDLSPSEISERVDDRDNSSAMEKAAIVIHLKEKDELLENIGSWITTEVISALKMYDKRVDQDYEELVEFVEDKTKNRSFNAYGGE